MRRPWRPATAPRGPRVLPALFVGGAAIVGVAAVLMPAAAVGLGIGLGFTLLALSNPAVGLSAFLLVAFIDIVRVPGAEGLSLTKLAGLVLALAWLARLAIDRRPEQLLFTRHPGLTLALVGLTGWAAMSTAWAENAPAATEATTRYALNVALAPIVYSAIRTRRHVLMFAAVFLAGVDVAALLGMVLGRAEVDAYRLGGGVNYDPNELAAILVVGIGLAGALLVAVPHRALGARLAIAAGATAALLALVSTVSRGGIVALTAMLVAGVALGGRWRNAALGAAGVVAAVAFVLIATGPAQTRERLTRQDSSGRTDIWTVGWRIVEDRPVQGVGAGNFKQATKHYLLRPGLIERADLILDRPKVAHNVYLQILADLGVVGLALFLAIVAICVRCAARAVRLFERRGDVGMEVLGRALLVALASLLVAYFFLSEQYSKQLWLLLALGPALLALAQRPAPEPVPTPEPL